MLEKSTKTTSQNESDSKLLITYCDHLLLIAYRGKHQLLSVPFSLWTGITPGQMYELSQSSLPRELNKPPVILRRRGRERWRGRVQSGNVLSTESE